MLPEFIALLLLIIIANGTPVFMRVCFRKHMNAAIDFGKTLADGQRLFGASKTWRGLIGAALSSIGISRPSRVNISRGLAAGIPREHRPCSGNTGTAR